MKRASIVAAFLMLLFAIHPQPTPAAHTSAPPTDQARPTADQVTRHTRTTQTAQLTIVTRPGDTYGAIARTHCGTFTAWPALQQANKWPERRIPVGATAIIACQAATPIAAPPTLPKTIGAAWVHPLASGKLGNSCYRTTTRPGHNGVDIAQPAGTPIRAVTAGTIQRKAYQAGGAGYYVTIAHTAGIYTRYHHLRAHSPLALGATVTAGQTIGYVGATGNATGNHLHFEVMHGGTSNSNHLNPAPFMRTRGINIGC